MRTLLEQFKTPKLDPSVLAEGILKPSKTNSFESVKKFCVVTVRISEDVVADWKK